MGVCCGTFIRRALIACDGHVLLGHLLVMASSWTAGVVTSGCSWCVFVCIHMSVSSGLTYYLYKLLISTGIKVLFDVVCSTTRVDYIYDLAGCAGHSRLGLHRRFTCWSFIQLYYIVVLHQINH